MYKYEYETVSCDIDGWGFGAGNIYSIEDYRSIINKRVEMDGDMLVVFRLSNEEPDILKR